MDNNFCIDRETYKNIKNKNRQEMSDFIKNLYREAYNDLSDSFAIDFDEIQNDISNIKGIGEVKLTEIMVILHKHLDKE